MFSNEQQQQQQPNITAPVFGCIIPSRPIQTNPIHIPPNRFIFQLENAESINHLVVFLTGFVPLPENYAASIHFQFPNKPDWQLLGMLSATKPSAIFRLKGTMVPSTQSQSEWTMNSDIGLGIGVGGSAMATLGIFVAPIPEIEAECSELNQALVSLRSNNNNANNNNTTSLPELARAIGLNLFRYLSSFSTTSNISSNGLENNQSWIPISVLEKWWKQFEFKLFNSVNPQQWLLDSSANG